MRSSGLLYYCYGIWGGEHMIHADGTFGHLIGLLESCMAWEPEWIASIATQYSIGDVDPL